METCSRAEIMRWGLAMHPKDLWCQAFRLLPNLLGVSQSLMEFQKVEEMKVETAVGKTGKSTELPQDILLSIFATLDMPDLVRAGSVCSSWRSAYTSLLNLGQCKEHITPCQFYTSESDDENVACLYSLAEQRVYKLTRPEPTIRSRLLIGSSNGWLVTVDEACEMLLVNPITGQQINVPSVATIEHAKPIYDTSGSIHKYGFVWHCGTMVIDSSNTFTFGEFREWFYYKAFVFSNASTGGYIVVLIHKPLNQISVARKGDDKWTWLPPDNCYSNCVYKDDLLYAVSGGEIRVFDLSGPIPAAKIIMKSKIEWWNGSSYITEAPHGGDLLHTHRSTGDINYDAEADPKASVWHTEKMEVYKIDVAEETVAEINCLNDHVLFLGHNQSLCLHANEYPPLKANHAYFTDDTKFSERYKNNCRDIGVLNEGNNDREDFVSPQHWSSWPTPIWITPNLVQL